jgi:hypothetical protein
MTGPISSPPAPALRSSTPPTRPSPTGPTRRPSSWRSRLPLGIGLAYVAAWIAGLSVWPSNLAIDSSASAVLAAYRTNGHAAFLQYLLVEGLAGLLLGALALTLLRRAARGGVVVAAGRFARVAVVAGLCAATISVTQCVLGMVLVATASDGRAASTHTLFDTINRLDGGKMLLLAAAARCLVVGRRAASAWLVVLLPLAAIALVVSGFSYLTLLPGGAWTVYLSGPLLLAGVLGLGYTGSGTSGDRSAR